VIEETPRLVSIVYVVEKDHAPVQHGTLEYAVSGGLLNGPSISDVLAQQAHAFLGSYLSRRARTASV